MPVDVTKSFWIGKFSKANQLASIERLARWMSQRVFGLKNILRHCISRSRLFKKILRHGKRGHKRLFKLENFLRQKQTSKLSRVSQGNVIKSF